MTVAAPSRASSAVTYGPGRSDSQRKVCPLRNVTCDDILIHTGLRLRAFRKTPTLFPLPLSCQSRSHATETFTGGMWHGHAEPWFKKELGPNSKLAHAVISSPFEGLMTSKSNLVDDRGSTYLQVHSFLVWTSFIATNKLTNGVCITLLSEITSFLFYR